MKERIQALMREKNLSALRFAELLEVQPSSISHLIAGRNNPNFEFVVKVLTKFPEIDPDWFITGKGEMFRATAAPIPAEKNVSLPLFEEAPCLVPVNAPIEIPPVSPDLPVTTGAETKKTEKIILLYSDQTFSVFENR
jgi:transcriptional regulator with XRE-family HTH domain